jgi:outer membrane protein OmpA-like peptidoglycan-associated protein
VLAFLWPMLARANAPAADGLPRSSDGFGGWSTDRSDVDLPGDLALRLDLDYIRTPLKLSTGGSFTPIVSNEIGLRAGLEVGLWHHLEAGVWVPVTFDTYSFTGQSLVPNAAGASTGYDLGAGDIRLFLKVNALKTEHLGLAFLGAAAMASGDANAFRSDGWGGDLRVIFDVNVRWLALAFNFGTRLHGVAVARDSTGAHLLDIGTELTWAAAFSAAVHAKVALALELAGSESVTPSVGDARARTAEAMLSVRVKPTPAFHFWIGLGRSLDPDSARADDVRLLGGFAWHPTGERVGQAADKDGDGIPDDRDRCPNEPEDKDGWQDDDGCPDPDNDGDGVPDVRDACPNDPEDKDGFQDEDGCPDVDNDGDGIPDNQDKCPYAAGPTETDGCPTTAQIKKGEPAPAPKPIGELPVIRFAHNSADLDGAGMQAVGKLVDFLGYHREIKRVRLEGHTSPDEKNGDVLSFERAQQVLRALAQRGVDPGRVQPTGYGSRRPAGKRAEDNRRVECIIVDLPAEGTP